MPFSEAEQRHYALLVKQGYSPEDARMITAFSRDRGQTPGGLPEAPTTGRVSRIPQTGLQSVFGVRESVKLDPEPDAKRVPGPPGITLGFTPKGTVPPAIRLAEGLPGAGARAPRATEAIAQAMGSPEEEAPAPAPEAATRAMPKLPPMLERPIRPLSESDSPEVKESMRRRLSWLKDAMAEPASPTQGIKRDEVEELRRRLSRTGGLRGIGEGLARMGDSTSESQILLGYHPDRDPTMNDDRAREERMRGRLGELEAKREQDALPENDPSSDLSQFIRGELGKLGFDFPESVSAAQVKQYFPGVYEPFRDRYEDMLGAMKGEAEAEGEATKALSGERTRFLRSPETQDALAKLSKAGAIKELIDSAPMGAAAAAIGILRLAEERGAISNQDMQRMKRLGIERQYDRLMEFLTSNPTEGYKKDLLALTESLSKRLRKQLQEQARREAQTFLRVHKGQTPYSEDDIDSFISDVYLGDEMAGGDLQSKVLFQTRDGRKWELPRDKAQEAEERGEGEILGDI